MVMKSTLLEIDEAMAKEITKLKPLAQKEELPPMRATLRDETREQSKIKNLTGAKYLEANACGRLTAIMTSVAGPS